MFTVDHGQIQFDLDATDTLVDAAIVSLFTNSRAYPEDEFLDQTQGGYWGDLLGKEPLGSKLWTLQREVKSSDVLDKSEEYGMQAIAWMKEEGLFESINLLCAFEKDRMKMTIRLDHKEFEVQNG